MTQFFTVKEIADRLKLNPLTIYDYIRRGKLSALRFGRYYRIDNLDFKRFIEEQKVVPHV